MAGTPRRETRKTHLDASVVPAGQALLARADVRRLEARLDGLGGTDGEPR